MSDNGWPDPARPGVPLNPERDGWHWCERDGGLEPRFWSSGQQLWAGSRNSWISPKMLLALFGYAGPCLTPAEVDARVKEAVDLGIDIATRELGPQIAMLIPWQTAIEDARSNWCDAVADDETPKAALHHLIQIEMDAALDPKVSQAAADLVAKAKRDALEEAARRVEIMWLMFREKDNGASDWIFRAHDDIPTGDDFATAIRALGEKE